MVMDKNTISILEHLKKMRKDFPDDDLMQNFFQRNLEFLEKAEEVQNKLKGIDKYGLLVRSKNEDTRRYAISKLAGVLSRSVEWRGNGSRQDTDWYTAERFIDNELGEEWLKELTQKYLVLSAYELLREEREDLPEISRNIVNNFWRKFDDYNEILDVLLDLPENERTKLFQEAIQRNYDPDILIGRDVWDRGYQGIKHTLPQEYGRILFE